jgi:predicted ATPase
MLKSVTLRNFKSFQDATLQLASLTLVVGANGAGKSNLFDALRFLRFVGSGVSIRDAIEGHATSLPTDITVPGIRGGRAEIVYFGAESSVFEVGVEVVTEDDEFSYWLRVDAATYRVVGEELRSKRHPGPYVFTTHPEVSPLAQDPDSPVISARFQKATRGPNPKRDFSPHSSILSQFQGRAAESRVNESVAQQMREELGTIQPLELRPEVLREYAPLGVFQLGEHGENFPAVMWMLDQDAEWEREMPQAAEREGNTGAIARLEAIQSWLSELTPHEILRAMTAQAPTGEVIFAVEEAAHPRRQITARSLSDGTLRFAALAVAVLGTHTRQTFLVEELENGIHAARIELLLRMLEESVRTTEGLQIVASTHSPTVLDLTSEDTLRDALVVGWDTELQSSRVVRLVDLPDFETIVAKRSPGALQAEGWIQFAADK